MKHILSFNFFLFLLLIVAIFYTYWDLPKTFYQQDEWLGSGRVLALGFQTVTFGLSPFQIIFGDSRPLTGILGVIFFKSFGFASLPLALYGVLFHIINTLLIFLISRKILKNHLAAMISAAYFGLSSVSQQSITWFAASFGVQPASFCIFSSIYLFLHFLEKKKNIFAHASLFFALLSLYFKESGIFLFIFLPLLPAVFKEKIKIKKYITIFSPFIIFASFFVLYRFIEMTIVRQLAGQSIIASSVYASTNQGKIFFIETILSRIIMYPLTSFSLVFIPVYAALKIASEFMNLYYPFITTKTDLISETVVLDLLAVAASLLLLHFIVRKLMANKYSMQVIYFVLLFFFLSIIPYIIVGKTFAYMEPRYYYIPIAASSILLGAIALRIFSMKQNIGKVMKVLFVLSSFWLLFLHVNETRQFIQMQAVIANERRGFLRQLQIQLPSLKDNTNIFYFTGDKVWYGENNFVPFQHGFGYSVPVIYYASHKIPKQLLVSGYLWALGSEGYKKIGGLDYGYYSSLDHLKKEMLTYHFNPSDVHAFSYDSQTKTLKNITKEVQFSLKKINQ